MLELPFVGVVVGFISGFFGIGGGTVVMPVMMALGYDVKTAAGISVMQMFIVAVFGSYLNYRAGRLRLDSGIAVGLGGLCGASLSGFIVKYSPEIVLEIGLLLTLAISFLKLFSTNVASGGNANPHGAVLFFIGFTIGAIALSMGVGGAVFLTPILVGFLGVDIKRAVCMGLFFIVFGSFSALLSLSYNGHVDYERGALLAVGGLLGVYFGTSQAHRARRETQKKWLLVLYVVLFALALKKVLQ